MQEKHGSLGLCFVVSNPPVVGSIVGNYCGAGGGVVGEDVGGGVVGGGVVGDCKNLLGSL